MHNLVIDHEFKNKIPPLTPDEFSRLEENIVSDGEVLEPIVVWNNTIIDGHNRWAIIQKHPDIPYKIKEMDFPDRYAAIVWMCRNQLGRRNVTDEQKTVLIGEAYKAQKKSVGGNRGNQHTKVANIHIGYLPKGKTADIIAKQFGVGAGSVQRAEHFLDGLNAGEEVSPGFKDAVLSGEAKAPKSLIAEIRNMEADTRESLVEAIRRNDRAAMKRSAPINNQLMGVIIGGLKSNEQSADHRSRFADDFSSILDRVVSDAQRFFIEKCQDLCETDNKKIIAALESAEAAIKEMKGAIIVG